MTTKTSQPNGGGDGQMLRGAPALRAAARNALTARGPAEPPEPADAQEPVATVEPEARAEPRPAETTGWNEAGWHQNVRLLTGPPREPEPPGGADMFAKRPAGPEACYGGAVPEVADVVEPEYVSVEPPVYTGTSLVTAGAVPEAAAGPTAYAGPAVRAERDPGSVEAPGPASTADATGEPRAALESVRTESGTPVPATYAEPEPEHERESADVPHSRAESWPTAGPGEPGRPHPDHAPASGAGGSPRSTGEAVGTGTPTADDGPSAPDADSAVPAEADPRLRDEVPTAPGGIAALAWDVSVRDGSGAAPDGDRAQTAHADVVAAEADPAAADGAPAEAGPVDSATPTAPSGIPAPTWDVSVPAGSGAVVPTRAALTFDSHRWSPLIVGEATHEIPVHLLFRDDEKTPGPVAGRPRARRAPVVPTPVVPPVLAPTSTSRPATPVDTKLVERPGPTLPGWTAALVGVAGLLGCLAVLWWVGAVPAALTEMFGLDSRPYYGIGIGMWALLALAVTLTLFAFGGLGRGRVGHAWVLTLFGEYRGSVRRTGLLWVSPLLLRRRVDVRLRHWRSEPMPAVDANGTALRVVVLVVWRVRDTVRAALGVRDHEEYLREQVEAAMARVLSQLPADAFHEAAPTLRNAEVVGEALTRMLSAECRPVGLDVFSAQPTRIEYAPEISAAMQRSRIAAIDARHRDTVLSSVVDAVDDTVHRLTSRGLVELDDYERKALVKDLTVAFYTGRHGLNEGN